MDVDWITLFKWGTTAFFLLGGLLAWLVKRAFRVIDLLFDKYDKLRADVDKLKLAMVAVDPSKTVLFESFMRDADKD